MSDAKPTYHLPPNFSTAPPPNGPFHLGTILKNFDKKEQMIPLNQGADNRIPIDTDVYTDHKGAFKATRRQLRSGEMGLWAKVMGIQGIGAELNISAARNATDTYSFENLDTEFFYPTSSYISSCVALSAVADYFNGCRYKKPVYLITGLKIAKGLTVQIEQGNTIEGRVAVGVNTPDGVMQVGPKAGAKADKERSYAFTESSDIVVGIQCVKLYHYRTKVFGSRVLKSDYMTSGAAFHEEADRNAKPKEANFIVVKPEDYNIPRSSTVLEGDEIWIVRESDIQEEEERSQGI